MAQFDLKKATIYLQDGYAEAGTVDNALGYVAAVTTMKILDVTGVIPVGATWTTAGDDTVYSVVSTVETLGNTTQITFTPGLAIATVDDQVLTFGGRRLELKIGEGNLTYDEKRNMEYKRDRGLIETVREGDEEPMDVRLDIQWEWLSSAGTDTSPTPEEVLKNIGLADDWISSSDDPCEPYAVDIVVLYDPDCSGVDAERITLPDYRWESLSHDLRAGTLATSGKCNSKYATRERITV